MFQSSQGTAPDIAGQGVANSVTAILSKAMLLDWLADQHGDTGTQEVTYAILAALPA